MEEKILVLKNVKKRINKREIIKGISFEIEKGDILGFLGPNGSGKTTTLRMIVGLSKPTDGEITICGDSITRSYVKAMTNVGCIIEGPDLYNYLTGFDNLEMLGYMNKNVTKKDIMDSVELLGMKNRIHDKVNTYSLGMKQRLGLAQALLHKPKLLVLDEPTNGLDPLGITEFRNIIINLAKEKEISILISSHLISEVQLMCNKVSIINNGKVLKNISVEELVNSGEVVWILNDNEKGKNFLKKRWGIHTKIINDKLEGNFDDISVIENINSSIIREGLKIKFVERKPKTLEELFLKLTEGNQII